MVTRFVGLPERCAAPLWLFLLFWTHTHTHTRTDLFSCWSSGGPRASCCYCFRGVVSATPACFPMDVFGTENLALPQRNNGKEKNKQRRSCETVIQAANPNQISRLTCVFFSRFPVEVFFSFFYLIAPIVRLVGFFSLAADNSVNQSGQ